ncbi:MAG: cytochrome C oxidase subunit IV family protein [Acidobacteriota bacterium]|nr:MAG: cytochrome C oxidase subunit IV family protein [Acidobacteriota bacterium]
MSEHSIPARIYYLVFATLLLLTLITVEVAFYDLGILTFGVALGIACFKAALVILYFMHVRYSSGLTGIFVAAGFVFLAIMLTFFLLDASSRDWQYQPDSSGFSMVRPS